MFNEVNTVEQMVLDTLSNGAPTDAVAEERGRYVGDTGRWRFVPATRLPRQHSDVLVEPMVQEALIRLNPEISADPACADEVLYRLRAILLSVKGEGLVRANELFAGWLRGEKSMPFGERGEHTQVRLIDFDDAANNDYVVTNQWIYPSNASGSRFDVVLLVNGIPLVIGEVKTPVRPAVTWVDGASDIHDGYEVRPPDVRPKRLLVRQRGPLLPLRLGRDAREPLGTVARGRSEVRRPTCGRAPLGYGYAQAGHRPRPPQELHHLCHG